MTKHNLAGGLLIVVEGIDGAGKTTLARCLRAMLAESGATVSLSKEPTTGPWGMKLRNSAAAGRLTPELEFDYLIRDRKEHVDECIRPALMRSEIVILDRYFPSMVAYQGAAGLVLEELLDANDFAPRPDLLLLLDLDPSEGLARIRARGDLPNHFESVENLTRCREIFLGLPMPKVVIDARQSADDVCTEAQAHVMLAISRKARQMLGTTPEAAGLIGEFLPRMTA